MLICVIVGEIKLLVTTDETGSIGDLKSSISSAFNSTFPSQPSLTHFRLIAAAGYFLTDAAPISGALAEFSNVTVERTDHEFTLELIIDSEESLLRALGDALVHPKKSLDVLLAISRSPLSRIVTQRSALLLAGFLHPLNPESSPVAKFLAEFPFEPIPRNPAAPATADVETLQRLGAPAEARLAALRRISRAEDAALCAFALGTYPDVCSDRYFQVWGNQPEFSACVRKELVRRFLSCPESLLAAEQHPHFRKLVISGFSDFCSGLPGGFHWETVVTAIGFSRDFTEALLDGFARRERPPPPGPAVIRLLRPSGRTRTATEPFCGSYFKFPGYQSTGTGWLRTPRPPWTFSSPASAARTRSWRPTWSSTSRRIQNSGKKRDGRRS